MRRTIVKSYFVIPLGVFMVGIVIAGGLWVLTGRNIPIGKSEKEKCDLKKISFNINNAQNGVYEFCIPFQDRYLQEIKGIDQDIKCNNGSSGRIGCTKKEYLCIGNIHLKNFRSILCKISSLDYVERIDRTFWE